MEKVKCPQCGQTLFWADVAQLEIKCPRCRQVVKIEIKQKQSEPRQEEQ